METRKSGNNRTTALLIVVLVVVLVVVGNFVLSHQKTQTVLGNATQKPQTQDITPEVPAYNPPPEFKYDAGTSLQEVLDSINPTVTDSDFKDLENL